MDKKFYRDLLDKMFDGVYFVDLDRTITYWNNGAERITGYSAREVIGHNCSGGILRHVSPNGRQLCLLGCPLLAVMKDGKPREADVFLHHKDGNRVPVTVRGQVLLSPDGRSSAPSRSSAPGERTLTRPCAGTARTTRWIRSPAWRRAGWVNCS